MKTKPNGPSQKDQIKQTANNILMSINGFEPVE